jgi:hypothetical protein
VYDQTRGVYEQTRGVYEQTRGVYEQTRGVYEQTRGVYGQTRSVYGQTRSVYGQTRGVYGRTCCVYQLDSAACAAARALRQPAADAADRATRRRSLVPADLRRAWVNRCITAQRVTADFRPQGSTKLPKNSISGHFCTAPILI